ncbi:ribonucleoside-diphosphate reductase [Halanaeroarchaeum sulfurireducens]|uniref:Ribonucleoside-diphosphate reductase n=1 Tax=Halanaeroarchaeum sulfurireducens TaxID=1604004 RepID=A0A0F7PDE8_9EURY|nr:LAGLIDADG family homing endonuclease [Halanaeroarchaeum sulfurireducens]AKH98210.1 ribonucleoside-diphosphate reductase [Halanaeroarchaeum sulfurireducens]
MSADETDEGELTLPVKRVRGETLEERLTANAYHNILPARYLKKDADGNLVEDQEGLFRRVARNIALAEAVYEADRLGETVQIRPDQVKPDHPRRDELAAEVFGEGVTTADDVETALTEENVNKFAYETVVPELPDPIREHVESMAAEYEELMSTLSFMPNSPTLMNAGDELQQLSACFVNSPEDDLADIHETAKEAALTFQCLADDARVHVDGRGVVSIADVEPGDVIRQRNGAGHEGRRVAETHAYDDAPTRTVTLESGISITGTPNHRLLVDDEWRELEDISVGDTAAVRLGWIPDRDDAPALESVPSGFLWSENRTVSNEDIAALHADGHSDYQIADRLDVSPSTVQRRRANELALAPNGSGGRSAGRTFDEDEFDRRHAAGQTDATIASGLGVSTATIQQHRAAESLDSNGVAAKEVRQPSELTPQLGELLGYWIGDGSMHADGVRFHPNRDEVLERLETIVERHFETALDSTWSEGCYEAVVHSHEIERWWAENFGAAKPEAKRASVPEVVWRADRETIAGFLRGLFTADGTLTDDRYPRLYSASRTLVEEVQQLMLGIGIPAALWELDSDDRDYHSVAPVGGVGIPSFAETVGFLDSRRDRLVESIEADEVGSTRFGHVEGSTWRQSVVETTTAGAQTVYDVTVEDDPEYVANSVVSHNSGGGMGYAFWRLRPYGDAVGSTGGIASGPITFMRTFDQMTETIAQGGTRRGAQMAVMRVSHPDVIEFIHSKNKDVSLAHTLKLNDPDDPTYTDFSEALEEARELIDEEGRVPEHLRNAVEGHLSNFNISVGITDDFMDALYADEEYTLTNPRTEEPHVATQETKEMYSRYGLGEYVEVGEKLSLPASILWERIVGGGHENGEPGVIYLERANKEHSFDVDEHPEHRMLATNPCVTGDTLISTEDGLVPAEQLYEQGVARDVVVDGRLSEDTVQEASSVFKTGVKDVYELTTAEGYELRLTADHRMMTDEGWVEAQNLEAGDTVHVQNRKGGFGSHGSDAEGRVLGWLVGDGHLKDGEERAVLNFYDEDATISTQFESDVNEVVREPLGNGDYEIGVNDVPRSDDYRGAHAVEQRIRSARLYEYAEQAGLTENKLQVPDAVMRGSEDMARGFLRALFTADGGVQGTAEKGVSVRLTSTELDLLKDVQRLLLNFGVYSKIYEQRHDSGHQEMPDGQGGTSTYDRQADHDLVISKDALLTFSEELGFLRDDKTESLRNRLGDYERGPYGETFDATVASVEYDGHEPVYDLTEPETHSFVANGLVCHNCGEQPLEEYEACNLGHINLSTIVAEDGAHWRAWSAEHGGEYDSQSEMVDAFLRESIDWEQLDRRIQWGTRFLEDVVTMSDFPVEEITEKVREMRKIGLGIMGLAQMFVQLGMTYGSDEANEVARQLMTHINHESKWTSHELASERGTFDEWEDSKYADPERYADWFEHHTGLDPEAWSDGFPIRNHNTTTIAPTGTTSMVGNTTGGCEPIFNVAYYKNVSDDVQGDEMLVEFDDYFLRTLEANGIDIDTVKEEAKTQMADNEFDGVEGLSTVPDAIAELFVTTGDLSGKQHASIQTALQEGVDSSISKTVNFSHDATVEDMDEVLRYIYDHGGKGVTVYRDGTRSKQVLTTRAQNTDFADMDEDEAAEAIVERIEEVFGELDEFLEREDVRELVGGDLTDLVSDDGYAEKRPRPDALQGVSQRVDTGYGKIYVTINEDPETGRPFELFANIGHSGGFTNSFTEALAKVVSTALRSGVDPEEIVDELRGTRSPKVAWDKGEQINSIPDAIGTAMERYLADEVDKPYPRQETLDDIAEEDREAAAARSAEGDGETDGGATAATDDATQSLIDAGESPECPECGSMDLYYSEGCKTCQSCGWSECS